MTNLKASRQKWRKLVITPEQLDQAIDKFDSGDPNEKNPHRPFVEWAFLTQHNMVVIDHTKLQYNYKRVANKLVYIEINGQVGQALLAT